MQSDEIHGLIDFGSRSVKIYDRHDGMVRHLGEECWAPRIISLDELEELIGRCLSKLRHCSRIEAFGTEFMRESEDARAILAAACVKAAIAYRTLSHHEEALLIRKASLNVQSPEDSVVVNVGGGSIQIATATGELYLLSIRYQLSQRAIFSFTGTE